MRQKFASIITVVALLGSARMLAAPLEQFNNGPISFEVPQGWSAESSNDKNFVRIKADNSASAIFVLLDKNLPRDLAQLAPLMKARAMSALLTQFDSRANIKTERECPSPRQETFSARAAIHCEVLLQEGDSRAVLGYVGFALPDTTGLAVYFAPFDKPDMDMQGAAWEVVEESIKFPTEIPYDSPSFSFSYPVSWQIQTGSNEATVSDGEDAFSVRYVPGARNSANTFNQCASEDKLIQEIYAKQYEPLATSTDHYPYTTVTYDAFMPGRLGGEEVWISIVHVEAYQPPDGRQVYVNVVPRAGGVYVVTFMHPGGTIPASERLRQAFLSTVSFRSGLLDKTAYCNYLGK